MSRGLTVTWNEMSRARWDAAHAAAAASLQQDWAYGVALKAVSPQAQVLRAAVTDGERHIALAQVTARAFALVAKFALVTNGPIWVGEVPPAEKRAAYRALKRSVPLSWPRLLAYTPDEERRPEAGLAGLSRIMTGEATVLIDLTQDQDRLRAGLDQNWRNRLNKAEKSSLVMQKSGIKPAQYRWLLDAEAKQRSKRGYFGMPLEMTEHWQLAKAEGVGVDRNAGLAVFRADLDRDAAAGMMFLIHGRRATYHVGWTSEEGRNNAAHNLIMWNAMLDLKARGVAILDLGGVNTQSGAGIARFKIETGGRVVQRAGVYV